MGDFALGNFNKKFFFQGQKSFLIKNTNLPGEKVFFKTFQGKRRKTGSVFQNRGNSEPCKYPQKKICFEKFRKISILERRWSETFLSKTKVKASKKVLKFKGSHSDPLLVPFRFLEKSFFYPEETFIKTRLISKKIKMDRFLALSDFNSASWQSFLSQLCSNLLSLLSQLWERLSFIPQWLESHSKNFLLNFNVNEINSPKNCKIIFLSSVKFFWFFSRQVSEVNTFLSLSGVSDQLQGIIEWQ